MEVRTGISKALILLISLASAVAGSLLIYSSVSITSSSWLDVLESSGNAYVREAIFYALVAAGILIVLISVAGFFGALREVKCLLSFYSFFLAIAVVIFSLIAAFCFLYHKEATLWQGTSYPASEYEPRLGLNFNKVYCYSQGLHYCTQAPAGDTLISLYPHIQALGVEKLNAYKGINSLCESSEFNLFASVDAIQNTCRACKEAENFVDYDHIYKWSSEKCPLTVAHPAQLKWCGEFLFQGKVGQMDATAPYALCRDPVLEFWRSWSLTFAVVATSLGVSFLLLIVGTCFIKRRTQTRA